MKSITTQYLKKEGIFLQWSAKPHAPHDHHKREGTSSDFGNDAEVQQYSLGNDIQLLLGAT